jgi:hypothetical protein
MSLPLAVCTGNWSNAMFAAAESHAHGIKSDEWACIFACVVEDWALYGNSQVSDVKSELTQMLTGWNTHGGAAEFLARRISLKRASIARVKKLAIEDGRYGAHGRYVLAPHP